MKRITPIVSFAALVLSVCLAAVSAVAGPFAISGGGSGTATAPLSGTGSTITASAPLIDVSQTWNNGAVTFTAAKVNVTNTASAAASLLQDWQVGGTSLLSIRKDGRIDMGATTGEKLGVYGGGGAWYALGIQAAQFQMYAPTSATRISFGYGSSASFTETMAVDNNTNSTKLGSAGLYGFTATNPSAALDTAISRNAAGIVEINSGTVNAYRDLKVRQHYVDFTNTATVGAVTINKAAGKAIVGAGTASTVVTNSLVTANSQVICTVNTNDATAILKNCTPAAGSFTITTTANATADTNVAFIVFNQ